MARSALREFDGAELRDFLQAVDRHLKRHVKLTIIGGSAIALAYSVGIATTDIDTLETNLRGIERALERAREDTGLNVPVSGAAVADVPFDSEERLIRLMPELERLELHALEKHDLALSKTVRGYRNDLEAIAALHRRDPLVLPTLIGRYRQEMSHAIGHRARLDSNFVLLIDYLFGEIEAERVKRLLERS